MTVLGGGELVVHPQESVRLARALGRVVPRATLEGLRQYTGGWIAAMVLWLQRGGPLDLTSLADSEEQRAVFEYFSREIFDRLTPSERRLLLRTAFLPATAPAQCLEIVGEVRAEATLAQLSRRVGFVTKRADADEAYEVNPLFRRFLLSRAREELSPPELAAVQRKSARLLAQNQHAGQALSLLKEVNDWVAIDDLLAAHGPAWVESGQHEVLLGCLRRCPLRQRRQYPWLSYWLGAALLPSDPKEARGAFEQAFSDFVDRNDVHGTYLSWVGIIDTFVFEWGDFRPLDAWIQVIEDLLAKNPTFPSPLAEVRVTLGMLNALTWRQPGHPKLPRWAERARRVAVGNGDPSLRLSMGSHLLLYYLWVRDISRGKVVIDALRSIDLGATQPLIALNWRTMEAMYSWFTAEHTRCMAAVREGTELADRTDVHLLSMFTHGAGVFRRESSSYTKGRSLRGNTDGGRSPCESDSRPPCRAPSRLTATLVPPAPSKPSWCERGAWREVGPV